jgi:hypothetical protein
MSPRISPSNLFLLGVALLIARPATAQLVSKSPFLPPQAASTAPTANAPLQFIGYVDTREGRLFRLHDPAKKVSTWVKLNEKQPEFDVLVKQHDESQKPATLTIEHQGKTLTLTQRESKIVSSGNAAQAIPPPTIAPAPAPNVAPAVIQSVVTNPTPADEQRRLEAVAAEVARRRALREQATQQISQGPQTPAPAQPPMPQQAGRATTTNARPGQPTQQR